MDYSLNWDISLQPKQWELFRCLTAKGYNVPTCIGFGGSRGGSKSGGAQRCALALALSEPGIGVMIFRRLSDDLLKNHINKFLETWPVLEKYYEASKKRFRFPAELGGSVIDFVSAETSRELAAKTRGIEWKYIFVDQSEELIEDDLKRIETCNRWPGTGPGECKVVYLFNPGGPGTEYLRRIFFLQQYHGNETPHSYHFIQAYGWDNYQWLKGTGLISEEDFYRLPSEERFELFINHSDYGRKMNALPESLRMGELLGRFDAFSGQYFAGVWDESKVILTIDEAERLIQPWWTRWSATDWGFAHHSAHIWFASGKLGPHEAQSALGVLTPLPIDVVVVYRELVVNETAEDDLARRIAEMSQGERIQHEFLSPDAFAKKGSANTVAEQLEDVFRRHALPSPESADNDRIGGWRLLYHGLKQTCSMRNAEIDAELAKAGPMLLISANCPQVIGSLPMLVRDDKNREDVLKTPTLADDVADALRYGYKSMLDPRSKAPKEVRAAELASKYQDMTAKAMALARFQEQERRHTSIIRKPRGR